MDNIDKRVRLDQRRNKRTTVLAAFIFSIVMGPFALGQKEGSLGAFIANLVSILAIPLLTFSWCYFDCLEHNLPVRKGLRWLMVLLGPFGLFVHLLKSRGVTEGLIASAKALGLMAALFLVFVVSGALFVAAILQLGQ